MFNPKRDLRGEKQAAKLIKLASQLTVQQVTLEELEPGMLFRYGDTLGFKSEYHADGGAIEAYCLGSGEMFWGGTTTPQEQAALMVAPIDGEQLQAENAALRREVERLKALAKAADEYGAVAHFSDMRPRQAENALCVAAIEYVRAAPTRQDDDER